jgi:hypothetical protein
LSRHVALRPDRRRNCARGRRPIRSLTLCLVALASASAAAAHIRPDNFWTTAQAESVRIIRGTAVVDRRCRPLDRRHFRCSAVAAPRFARQRTVSVGYTLHPLGRYRARRPPYALTNVSLVAFGVP